MPGQPPASASRLFFCIFVESRHIPNAIPIPQTLGNFAPSMESLLYENHAKDIESS